MKNKKQIVIGGIILSIIMLFIGTQLPFGKSTPTQINGNQGGAYARGTRGGNGGGMTSGSIVSINSQGIVIQDRTGNSKIVLTSTSTPIEKMVTGNSGDLSTGTNVTIIGTTNSDGSVIAQSIQIRGALSSRP